MAVAAPAQISEKDDDEAFSPRQREVLDAALDLIMTAGDSLTMASVARRASCSKETLYKWFGDRDGLLTATVQWQASKVRLPSFDRENLDYQSLEKGLADFGESWLSVLTGQVSIALNGMAIAHSSAARSGLGGIVLDNGRFAIGRRVKPVLEMARDDARLILHEDPELATPRGQALRVLLYLQSKDEAVRLLRAG